MKSQPQNPEVRNNHEYFFHQCIHCLITPKTNLHLPVPRNGGFKRLCHNIILKSQILKVMKQKYYQIVDMVWKLYIILTGLNKQNNFM